jgi:MFS family permease
MRFLASRRSFVFLVVAASIQSISGYGVLAWGPTFLGRVHQMGGVEIGIWFGLTVGLGGIGGAFLGGSIADRLGARDPRWYLFLSAIVCLTGVPFAAGFALAGDATTALLSFIPFYVLAAMYVGPMLWMVQGLVKLRMRAMASAILLFILNMVGLGLGPFLIGFMNDQLADRFGVEAIRYSLLVVGMVGVPSSVFFLLASRTLREDLRARDA